MRRLAAIVLVLGLSACGAAEPAAVTPSPSQKAVARKGVTLACGTRKVVIPAPAENLERAGSFARLGSLRRRLKVRGVLWRDGDEQLRVGVVCGVRTAEQFATLVAGSRLTAYQGKPALRWNTRGGLRHHLWLDRPGVAVYLAATPGVAAQISKVAAGVK
ncbi:hypothetical protein HII36_02840 [Nonomuraea sp. NN258]|uniref:hypothetical protein n=1 Tax=Nonomuraea antri TaxID=2730852 RepID=UPI001568E45B|nr:hypothetical protein [Nonomuraea antri]NRQ30776.1 hypothetical protein [Nonomuraea antri]